MARLLSIAFLLLSVLPLCSVASAQEQPAAQPEAFRMVAPLENAEVTGKKPEIKVEFLTTIAPGSLVVLLDGMDITQVVSATDKGFTYSPALSLPAGDHAVLVFALAPIALP